MSLRAVSQHSPFKVVADASILATIYYHHQIIQPFNSLITML